MDERSHSFYCWAIRRGATGEFARRWPTEMPILVQTQREALALATDLERAVRVLVTVSEAEEASGAAGSV